MDLTEVLLKRFDSEVESKKPAGILVCFSKLQTGRELSRRACFFALPKAEKTSMTLVLFTGENDETPKNNDFAEYKNAMSGFISEREKEHITIRTFVKASGDYRSEIVKMSEDRYYSRILIGVEKSALSLRQIGKYRDLRSDPSISDAQIWEQFQETESQLLRNIFAVSESAKVPVGLFIDNGSVSSRNIFVPILDRADLHLFNYIYSISLRDQKRVMIWDAIGIISSDPRVQKSYQFIFKKSEGQVYLWDNNKKIEREFIQKQDLALIGSEGWSKLIHTPLQWIDDLPSTFIIKDITI